MGIEKGCMGLDEDGILYLVEIGIVIAMCCGWR